MFYAAVAFRKYVFNLDELFFPGKIKNTHHWLPEDVEWKHHALIVEAGFGCFPLKFAALHAARIPVSRSAQRIRETAHSCVGAAELPERIDREKDV